MSALAYSVDDLRVAQAHKERQLAYVKKGIQATFLQNYQLSRRRLLLLGGSKITTQDAVRYTIEYLFRQQQHRLSHELTALQACLMGQEITELFQVSEEWRFRSWFEKLWSKWLFVFGSLP